MEITAEEKVKRALRTALRAATVGKGSQKKVSTQLLKEAFDETFGPLGFQIVPPIYGNEKVPVMRV